MTLFSIIEHRVRDCEIFHALFHLIVNQLYAWKLRLFLFRFLHQKPGGSGKRRHLVMVTCLASELWTETLQNLYVHGH